MRFPRSLGLLGIYVGSQLVALALAIPFLRLGYQTTANPGAVTNILPYLLVIVLAPLAILFLADRAPHRLALLRYLLLGSIAFALVYTMDGVFGLLLPTPFGTMVGVSVDPVLTAAFVVAEVCFLLLLMEPQWYVVDTVGFLAAGSLITLLGISLGILPALLLLGALMVYDAVAVYGTRHMIALADVVTDLKLPILLVMPTQGGFDYTQGGSLRDHRKVVRQDPTQREAVFMGLGDVIIPGILVVSSFVFLPSRPWFGGIPSNLAVSLAVLAGSLVGYGALMGRVNRGNPQAGLPFLNGGAMVGYVLAYLAIYHSWGLGLSFTL
jgi:presenilin-like A22 family membrane protease